MKTNEKQACIQAILQWHSTGVAGDINILKATGWNHNYTVQKIDRGKLLTNVKS